jgi:hypothetical protein
VSTSVTQSSPDQANVAPSVAASQRLFNAGCAALVATCAYLLYKTKGEVSLATFYGILIIVLSALPALRWAQKRRLWFPSFEIGMLTCIAFYAVPLLSRHAELTGYSNAVITEASFYVVVYLAAANLGFSWTARRVDPPPWASTSLLPASFLRKIPAGMFLNTIYLYVSTFTTLIPFETQGTLRALFFGIGILSTFVLARQWGAEQLSFNGKVVFVANLAVQVVFLFSHLYLINGISLVALALIAYSATRRKIPWVLIAAFVSVVSLLHLGKPQMRLQYWEGHRPLPTVVELPAFFTEWVGYSLTARALDAAEEKDAATIFERASLIQMLCLTVERVPEYLPFLAGESYVDIPALFIPRQLWPDKPSSLLANVRLAVYFNLVDPTDAFKVSIAFGIISEAYANFGAFGVGLLGLIFGAAMKRVAQLSENAAQFSILGILMILLTAWSFQVELVLATWISSLFQAAVACIGVPFALKRIFGG